MRIVYLTPTFRRMHGVHVRPGSPQDDGVRCVLADLAEEDRPLPAPGDEEAIRSPLETIWARRVPGTDLVLTYSILPMMVELRGLRVDC